MLMKFDMKTINIPAKYLNIVAIYKYGSGVELFGL
jgi:hypothetical protein